MAKQIEVSPDKFAIVDDDFYPILAQLKWHLHSGYPATKLRGKTIFMHRIVNRTPEGLFTDHVNQDKLDNRRINLRSADKKLNGINRGAQENNDSGYKNVAFHKASNLWTVEVRFNGKRVVRYFKNKEEAIEHSEKIRKEVYGF
jgi:hypothetical protein